MVTPLSALTWAAVGKDPGFTPLSLVEFLRRRGRHRPEEVARLNLAVPFDPVASKELWLGALDDAEAFARSGPTEEVGCLYYSPNRQSFAVPDRDRDLTSRELPTSVRRSVCFPACRTSELPPQVTNARTSARRSSYRPLAGSSSSKVARILSYSSAAPSLSC